MPSCGPSLGLGEQTESEQAFAAVGRPGRLQKPPPGHTLTLLHGAPSLVPPMQRRPPHAMPGEQSALVLHASASADAQVSQKQFPDAPVHGRFFSRCTVPVVAGLNPMLSTPIALGAAG